MKRKGLSIFLAVCLVFSMMTFAASAADDGGKVKRESISVEDTGASFRVVKGGRLEISSESAAEDGSYSWEAVKKPPSSSSQARMRPSSMSWSSPTRRASSSTRQKWKSP